jgi:hypothetical protein
VSGEAVPLSVVPTALQGASKVIGGQAVPLAAPSSAAPASMEAAGQAAAAADQAIHAFCAAFAQRLSTVASGLDGAAGAYTGQEAANSQAVAAVLSGQVV